MTKRLKSSSNLLFVDSDMNFRRGGEGRAAKKVSEAIDARACACGRRAHGRGGAVVEETDAVAVSARPGQGWGGEERRGRGVIWGMEWERGKMWVGLP